MTPEQVTKLGKADSIWKIDENFKPQGKLFHSYIEERFSDKDIMAYSLDGNWRQQVSAVECDVNVGDIINSKWVHRFANEKLSIEDYPDFCFGKEKTYQPHLWLIRNEGVGLFSIGVQALGRKDPQKGQSMITDVMLVNMNYALNKLDKQASKKYNVCYEKRIKEGDALKSVVVEWNMSQVVNAFLKVSGVEYKSMRMHPLTHTLVLPESCGGTKYTQEDITRLTKQLMYAINERYGMDSVQHKESGQSIFRAFDGITFGSAVEATCVVVSLKEGMTLKDEDSHFFTQFRTDSFPKRYFWLFLLAYMQQQTLRKFLHEITQISEKYSPEDKEIDEEFWHQMHRIAYVKSRNHYSEVSMIHQHNEYYSFISRTLGLNHFINEIDMKTKAFRLVVDRYNEQRKAKAEQRITIFSLFLALVCIVQVIDSIYTIIDVCNTGWDGGVNTVKICASVIVLLLVFAVGLLVFTVNGGKQKHS